MREQTGAADVPPRIPTSSLVPEGGDLNDLPYQQLDFCPAAIDHLGNFSPFAMLLARRLAESLADVYHTDSYRSLSYIRRFISRIIAFNLSGRLLASLRNRPDPDQRRIFYKSKARAKAITRRCDKQRREEERLARSTLFASPPSVAPASTQPSPSSPPLRVHPRPGAVAAVASTSSSSPATPPPPPVPANPSPFSLVPSLGTRSPSSVGRRLKFAIKDPRRVTKRTMPQPTTTPPPRRHSKRLNKAANSTAV